MLDRIEKKIGKYAIKNLIYYILGGYVIGYILLLTNSRLGFYQYITLEPALVMKGQVWRLFTWICTVPQGVSFFIIFMFLLYFFIGRSLEQNLGTFKYNLYMFSGWFFTTLGAMIVYWITYGIYGGSGAVSMNVSTYYLNLASFLAFAVLFPAVRMDRCRLSGHHDHYQHHCADRSAKRNGTAGTCRIRIQCFSGKGLHYNGYLFHFYIAPELHHLLLCDT